MPNSQKFIVADLPNAGMANLLFTWAKAKVFSKVHQRPLYVFGWSKIHIGPWLRGERVKRYYGSYFKNSWNPFKYLQYKYLKRYRSEALQIEPLLENANSTKHFIFDLIPFPDRKPYFHDLWNHREYLKAEFDKMLRYKFKLNQTQYSTDIALHIRRGDFKHFGDRYIPLQYYIDCITQIRQKFGTSLKAIIYTDGYEEDVKEVLNLPNVTLSNVKKDILEFQALSACKVLITSYDSTFGYWAGFLSEAHIILHPKHFGGRIREEKFPRFEGTIDEFIQSNYSL